MSHASEMLGSEKTVNDYSCSILSSAILIYGKNDNMHHAVVASSTFSSGNRNHCGFVLLPGSLVSLLVNSMPIRYIAACMTKGENM